MQYKLSPYGDHAARSVSVAHWSRGWLQESAEQGLGDPRFCFQRMESRCCGCHWYCSSSSCVLPLLWAHSGSHMSECPSGWVGRVSSYGQQKWWSKAFHYWCQHLQPSLSLVKVTNILRYGGCSLDLTVLFFS